LLWRKDWFEWEKPHVANFVHELSEHVVDMSKEDEWVWKDNHNNVYTVKPLVKS